MKYLTTISKILFFFSYFGSVWRRRIEYEMLITSRQRRMQCQHQHLSTYLMLKQNGMRLKCKIGDNNTITRSFTIIGIRLKCRILYWYFKMMLKQNSSNREIVVTKVWISAKPGKKTKIAILKKKLKDSLLLMLLFTICSRLLLIIVVVDVVVVLRWW